MKKRTIIIFTGYIWTKLLLGLTFHPLISSRQMLRRPVFFPVIFSPFIGLFLLFIFGRIAALFLSPHGVKREIISLFLSTTLLSIIFWQLLLFYLLGSFLLASWKRR